MITAFIIWFCMLAVFLLLATDFPERKYYIIIFSLPAVAYLLARAWGM